MITLYGRGYILENFLSTQFKSGNIICHLSTPSADNGTTNDEYFKMIYGNTLNFQDFLDSENPITKFSISNLSEATVKKLDSIIHSGDTLDIDGYFYIVKSDGLIENGEKKYELVDLDAESFSDLFSQANEDGYMYHLILVPTTIKKEANLDSVPNASNPEAVVYTPTAINSLGLSTVSGNIISYTLFPEYTISNDKQAVFHYYLYF